MDFKGLLDDETLARIDRDAGLQQALALMAASGPSLMPQNLGAILLQGNQARDESRQQGLKGALQRQELMQQRRQQEQMRNIAGMFSPTNAQAALAGGGGPTVANAQRMGQPIGPEQAQRALLAAIETGDPKIIEYARSLKETLMPGFKTQSVQELMVGEKLKKFAVGEDGTMRELGVAPEKLIQVDAGGQKLLVSENTGKEINKFAVTMDPAQKAQIDLGRSRLSFDIEQANRPQYDFSTVDGRVVVGDKRTGQIIGQTGASPKDVQQVTGAVNAVLEAAPIIPKSTGSLVGRGMDLAAGAFGFGTEGAKNTARLEVIGAKLTANVPRFEGPQSNIDVQFYKQAAADVANPLKPDSVRLEALRTAAQLIKKEAQAKGIPVPSEFEMFLSGQEQTTSLIPQSGVVDFNNLPRGQ